MSTKPSNQNALNFYKVLCRLLTTHGRYSRFFPVSLSFSSHSIMMIFLSNRCLLHVLCFERYLVYIHTCIDVLVYGHDFLVLFFQNNFFFSMLHYCECCALFIGRSGDLLILFVNYSHVHNHARYFAIK